MSEFVHLTSLRRAVSVLAVTGVLAGTTTVAIAISGSTVGATSTKHHASGMVNGSPAVENSACASFKL